MTREAFSSCPRSQVVGASMHLNHWRGVPVSAELLESIAPVSYIGEGAVIMSNVFSKVPSHGSPVLVQRQKLWAPLFLGIVIVRGSNGLPYICGPSMVDLRLNVYSVLSAQYRREVFLLALVNGIDHMHKLSGARSTVLAFYGAWHTRRCHLAALTRIGDSALSVSRECAACSIIPTIIPSPPLRHTR